MVVIVLTARWELSVCNGNWSSSETQVTPACPPPHTRTHTLEDLLSRSFSFKIWLCWDGLFHISFVSWPEGKACISERNQISIEAGSREIAHFETRTLKCHELTSFWLPMSRWIGGQVGSRPGAERSLWAKHRIPVAQLLCDLPGRRLTEARSFHQGPLKCWIIYDSSPICGFLSP